jgi:biotin carboxyl carrier protein
MKYTVKIEGRVFAVEIGNLQERPIRAVIGGETFEVWPELTTDEEKDRRTRVDGAPHTPPAAPQAEVGVGRAVAPAAPAGVNANHDSILAPIPGVIVSIAVQPGAAVEAGQEVCVLEAMKMKSPIRAPRAGVIAAIQVSVGQQVKHREALVDYAA